MKTQVALTIRETGELVRAVPEFKHTGPKITGAHVGVSNIVYSKEMHKMCKGGLHNQVSGTNRGIIRKSNMDMNHHVECANSSKNTNEEFSCELGLFLSS